MGCVDSKVTPLPEDKHLPTITPSPTFDELPVEIIYKILDELDVCTILISLYNVCHRFDEILSTYNQYDLDLKNISLKNFELISSRIRPEQVTKLTLSDDENSPGIVELFFTRFSIETFIRLQSLTLIQINNDEHMNKILITIGDQTSLTNFSSIKIINSDESYDDIFVELIMSVLAKPSLRKIYFDLSYTRTTSNPLPWIEQCSITQMTFRGTCSINFVRNTFIHAPQLETFKADDFDFGEEVDMNNAPNNHENDDNNSDDLEEDIFEPIENVNNDENQLPRQEKFASIEPTNHLTSLELNTYTFSMSKLEWLLQELPELKRLRLLTTSAYDDESILDGHRWEILLPNIDRFEFIFSVNISNTASWDIDTCITKFRTPFWIDEKQWFVSLEKYDDELIFYSLPYQNSFYGIKNDSSSYEYRSTTINSSLLQLQAMNNVRDLYIDTSNALKPRAENANHPRFTHVTHLFLYGRWSRSKTFLTDLRSVVNLNSIEELNRDECVPTADFIALLNLMPNLQSIKTSTNLLDALNAAKFRHTKCLRSFIVDPNSYEDQRSVNIEPFCDMFPRIQHLILPLEFVENCQHALDQLKPDLISVIFRIPANDSVLDDSENENENEEEHVTPDVFAEWIQQLPEQYRCHKKQRQIHISLK